jgi:hypothetical protein
LTVPNPQNLELQASLSISHELLTRRSARFRQLVENESSVYLADTSLATLTKFYLWSYAQPPNVDHTLRLTLEENVNLGIFAHDYIIPALVNHTNDALRSNIGSGTWKLGANVVDRVYAATSEQSKLRKLFQDSLGSLPNDEVLGQEAWKAVMIKNTSLAWEYLQVAGKQWDAATFLKAGGACAYHDHRSKRQDDSGDVEVCPHSVRECFPDGEEASGMAQDQASRQTDTVAVENPVTVDAGERPLEPEAVAAHVKELLAEDATTGKRSWADEVSETANETQHRVGNGIMLLDESKTAARELNDIVQDATLPKQEHGAERLSANSIAGEPKDQSNGHKEAQLGVAEPVVDEVNGSVTWDSMMASKGSSPKAHKAVAPVPDVGQKSGLVDTINGNVNGHTTQSTIANIAKPYVVPRAQANGINGITSPTTSAAEDVNGAVSTDLARTLSDGTSEHSAEKIEESTAKKSGKKNKKNKRQNSGVVG